METYFDGRVLHAFNALRLETCKSDFFRACLLYRYGGIWGDVRQRYLRPLSSVFDLSKPGTQLFRDLDSVKEGALVPKIFNSLFAASPRTAYLKVVIETIVRNVTHQFVGSGFKDSHLEVTGSYLWMKAFTNYRSKRQENAIVGKVVLLPDDHPNNAVVDNEGTLLAKTQHFSMRDGAVGCGNYSSNFAQSKVYITDPVPSST